MSDSFTDYPYGILLSSFFFNCVFVFCKLPFNCNEFSFLKYGKYDITNEKINKNNKRLIDRAR